MLRVAYYPAFDDEVVFTDRYWRGVHYLSPMIDRISAIEFSGSAKRPGPPPDYFDPRLPAREGKFRDRVAWKTSPDLSNADFVIVWDAARAGDAVLKDAKRHAVLDPN